jgi:hypothetical protein
MSPEEESEERLRLAWEWCIRCTYAYMIVEHIREYMGLPKDTPSVASHVRRLSEERDELYQKCQALAAHDQRGIVVEENVAYAISVTDGVHYWKFRDAGKVVAAGASPSLAHAQHMMSAAAIAFRDSGIANQRVESKT